jgi:hypothetical protein
MRCWVKMLERSMGDADGGRGMIGVGRDTCRTAADCFFSRVTNAAGKLRTEEA